MTHASHLPAIDALRSTLDPASLISADDAKPLLEEWRGRWQGTTPLVVAPGTPEELSRIVTHCAAHKIPMVPQGGNTGLVGGQIPTGEVLVILRRMRAIRDVSPTDFTLTAEAGATLADVQQAAENVDRLFPLSIGSQGSCQIGGILSTNAGGVNVLRYGNARELTLGLEVVMPDGQIWSGLNRLRKNNTGYDLKQLFIGAEGTLGFITAAVLKLSPLPTDRATAFVALPSAEAAIELLSLAQDRSSGQLTSFELMNAGMVEIVLTQFPALSRPLPDKAPYYVLLELSSGQTGTTQPVLENLLEEALTRGLVLNAAPASNMAQREALWRLRHNASEAMKKDPSFCVKCDVSVPIREIPAFLQQADEMIAERWPGARVIAFGHAGDGNIHYDILAPHGGDDAAWRAAAPTVEHAVHDIVVALGGSISAEHGIGTLKRDEMEARKSTVEMAMMRAVKSALDPDGLMNPGKLLR